MLPVPPRLEEAFAQAAEAQRVLVLGATDVGKSSFIAELLLRRRPARLLVDLDPGRRWSARRGRRASAQLTARAA